MEENQEEGKIIIEIEFCKKCGTHQTHTNHNE
jgi:hypothetical protein